MKQSSILFVLVFITGFSFSASAQSVALGVGFDPMFSSIHVRGDVDCSQHLRLGIAWTRENPILLGLSANGRRSYIRSWYAGAAIAVLQPLSKRWQLYGRTGVGLRRSEIDSGSLSNDQYRSDNSLEARMGGGIEYHWGRLRFFGDAALRWKESFGFNDPLVLAVGASFTFLRGRD